MLLENQPGTMRIESLRQVHDWEDIWTLLPWGPRPWEAGIDQGLLVLHRLDISRGTVPDEEPYLWTSPPAESATAGLVVKRFNHKLGAFVHNYRSELVEGRPVFTRGYGATRWPASDAVVLFGGTDQFGEQPAALWQGLPVQEGDETVYQWREVPGPHPAGSTGAFLAADEPRNRLVLLFGRAGETSSAEAHAFDVSSQTWSSLAMPPGDLAPLDSAGFSHSDDQLYVYGGRRDQETRGGLYRLDLATLQATLLSDSGGPGPRAGAAVYHAGAAGVVYVYGGTDAAGVAQRDLWRFDLRRGAWSLVSDAQTPGAPPAMAGASLVVDPVRGAATLFAGPRQIGGTAEPMWQLWQGQWSVEHELLQSE